MTEHTPQQWRDLYTQVNALIANPATPAAQKERAREVIGIIRRTPGAMTAINDAPPATQEEDWIGWL
jgi:hypothetical protein